MRLPILLANDPGSRRGGPPFSRSEAELITIVPVGIPSGGWERIGRPGVTLARKRASERAG